MSKNLFQQKQKNIERSSREKSIGCWWEFGQIKEVNEENMTVKVIMFTGEGEQKEDIGWHPLRKGEGTVRGIQMIYGKLRAEMPCIIHYKGKQGYPKPGNTFIEVIGEGPGVGIDSIMKEEPTANEKETGPFLLMSGGLTG